MAIGLGAGRDSRIKSGTAHPEGNVTADPGTLYERTQEPGGTFVKWNSTGAFGWAPSALETRQAAALPRYYVSKYGSDSDDGLSGGHAFLTIQKAVNELLTTCGEIIIGTGTYDETVTIASNHASLKMRGVGASIGNNTIIRAPSAAVNCISVASGNHTFENITVAGYHGAGAHSGAGAGQWTGIGWKLNNASRSTFLNCGTQNNDTGVWESTYGGTALEINNTEGAYFRQFSMGCCQIGFELVHEVAENVFEDTRGQLLYSKALRMGNGGGNAGGNLFLHWKTIGSGNPSSPTNVIDIGGEGGNTFVLCDWDEAAANTGTVQTDNNTFIHHVTSPAFGLTVSGKRNHFTHLQVNGAAVTVTGSYNVFDSPTLKGSGVQLQINGRGNVVENETSSTGVASASGVEVKRREGRQAAISSQYVPVKMWHTDFTNAEYDAAMLTMTNFSRVTGSGDVNTEAIQATTPANPSTCFITGQTFRNVDVRIRYKVKVAGGFTVANTKPFLYGRYLGPNNHYRGEKNFAAGNPILQGNSVCSAAVAGSAGVTDADVTNTTTYRFLRMRVIEDLVQMKSWFVGSAEPDWQLTQRLRAPQTIITGGTLVADNVNIGLAGFEMQYTDAYITELIVSELSKTDDNMLWNPELQGADPQGYPPFWFPSFAPTTGNTLSVVTATDRDGVARKALQCVQTADNAAGSLTWEQTLFASQRLGPTANYSRKRPCPQVYMPRAVEVSLWSKGTAITNSGSLAAIANVYQYDAQGNLLNAGDPDYFRTLGPNAEGEGTWDWFKTEWRVPLINAERLVHIHPYFGFHDATSRGTLLISDIVIRAVN